jgi:nickel/cobalt transporter (NicO) family protein
VHRSKAPRSISLIAAGGRATAFETVSSALITIIGLYLIVGAIWPKLHVHHGDGRVLAVVTGLIPCPLTTFILMYALAHNKLAVGLAAVVAMFGGVVFTLVGFAVAAVASRDRLMKLLQRTEAFRRRFGFWAELAGASTVFLLGVVMLSNRLDLKAPAFCQTLVCGQA